MQFNDLTLALYCRAWAKSLTKKNMKVKELIEILKTANQNKNVLIACDEEWNTVFEKIEINKEMGSGNYVLFGLSGSEL